MFAKITITNVRLLDIPKNANPLRKLLYFLLLVVVSFSFFSFAAFLLGKVFFGIDAFGMNPEDLQKTNIDYLKFLQFFNSVGMFIVPPILFFIYQDKGDVLHPLKLSVKPNLNLILATILCLFASLPVINFLVDWNQSLVFPDFLNHIENWMRNAEQNAERLTKAFLEMENATDWIVNILIMALIPALGEELVFRGVLQQELTKKFKGNYHFGIWLSAAIFSAIHIQFFGFFPRMFLGAVFGYFLVYSGSLWIPILAHFINNALAVTISYYAGKSKIAEDVEHIGEPDNLWFLSLAGTVVIFLVLQWMRVNGKKKSEPIN